MGVDSGVPRIVPQLAYEDIGAALTWLEQTFGYRELAGRCARRVAGADARFLGDGYQG